MSNLSMKNLFVSSTSFLDVTRFKKWLQACNNEYVAKKPPMLVYKHHRICRRHFDASSMNGGCRRLLKTAVPKLHLNLDQKCGGAHAQHDEDAIDLPMETDQLAENVIDEADDDGGAVQDTATFDAFEAKFDCLNAPTKSSQRRDIREYDAKLLFAVIILFSLFSLGQCV